MKFNKVVLLGGGVLGTQIALISAYTGHDTTIWLRSEDSITRTEPKIKNYREMMLNDIELSKELIKNPLGHLLYPKGLFKSWDGITEEKIEEILKEAKINLEKNIHIELDLRKALKDADIVIEAMAENVDAKIEMYKLCSDKMDEKTILCTNTSTLLPSTFANYTGRAEKYMALHFANEVWRNNTAECMGHAGTDEEIYNRVVEFAEEINMIPIKLHKEQPGYILNSLLVPLLDAGLDLWVKGVADPEMIDLTWKLATHSPKGPFEIMDIVGLKTVYNISCMKEEAKTTGSLIQKRVAMLKEKIDKNELGVNSGKGFYNYKSRI